MRRPEDDSGQPDSVDQRLEELQRKLRARGGRVTPQRLAILRVLLTADHPTIEQVYEQVSSQFVTMSLMTVYRTLALLREMGDVLELRSTAPASHYDGHQTRPHPHLVCGRCGRVIDSPVFDVQGLIDAVAEQGAGWQLTHELAIYGVCPECQAACTRGHGESQELS
jgi:Fur family peroxide stress response transcriptional regulator